MDQRCAVSTLWPRSLSRLMFFEPSARSLVLKKTTKGRGNAHLLRVLRRAYAPRHRRARGRHRSRSAVLCLCGLRPHPHATNRLEGAFRAREGRGRQEASAVWRLAPSEWLAEETVLQQDLAKKIALSLSAPVEQLIRAGLPSIRLDQHSRTSKNGSLAASVVTPNSRQVPRGINFTHSTFIGYVARFDKLLSRFPARHPCFRSTPPLARVSPPSHVGLGKQGTGSRTGP